MILGLCDNSNVMRVIVIAKTAINIIKYAVPILLLIFISIEYLMAIKNDDQDALMKANKSLVKKLIAAVLIFLIPTFVNLIINNTTPEAGTIISCIKDANKSNIEASTVSEAEFFIDKAKTTLSKSNYVTAQEYVNKLSGTNKTTLQNKLNEVYSYIQIKEAIDALKVDYSKDNYKKISEAIEKVSDKDVQNKLYELLEQAGYGKSLGKDAGTYEGSNGLQYFVNVPESATTNMPLVMFLHGDGGNASYAQNNPFYQASVKAFGNNYPYIIVAPVGGMWAETSGRTAALYNIIQSVCKEYSCDEERIIITGHSRGAIGTWHMVNRYPSLFYSAAPVSCGAGAIMGGSSSLSGSNFLHTKVRAFAGTIGDEVAYTSQMKEIVNSINSAGGNATFISLSGQSHGSTPAAAYTQSTILWMIGEAN